MDAGNRLWQLGYRAAGPDTAAEVERLEQLIGVSLPDDYRSFLLTVGGGDLDALSPCEGLTPIGDACSVCRLYTVAEVIDLLDSAVTPRNMVCVSVGNGGQTGCLSIAGLDHGHVFALDTQMRSYWDADTLARFPHLAPEIREFFRQRDAGELPGRPWGYDNCYAMAGSFTDFLERLRPTGAASPGRNWARGRRLAPVATGSGRWYDAARRPTGGAVMADEQNPTPEEARSWVRHPIPPEILAEIRAEYDKPETIAEIEAEIEDVIAGRARMYTMDEILAEIQADAGLPPQT